MKIFFLPVCLMFTTGCGLEGPIPSGPKPDVPAVNKAVEPNATEKNAPENQKTPEKTTAEMKPGTVREKAAVGMGEKGRGYGGDMITMPVKTMWTVREQIVLGQIRKALDLYKASEEHFPKTHQEFMDRIIKENHLQLPTLPAGHRYVYDPDTDELMVERPNNL
ncbi:MAG: hypothetical protein WCJ35_06060 [Planctomycetota bacterium]